MQNSKTFLFTNIIAPYRIGLLNKLNNNLNGNLKVFFDSKIENNRKWIIDEKVQFNYEILDSPRISYNIKMGGKAKLFKSLYFPYKVFLRIIKEKPQVIISSELGLRTIFAICGAKIVKSKIYLLSDVTNHSEKGIGVLKNLFRKFLCRKVNGAIAHGTLSREYLLNLGMKESKIIVSPYSTDNDYFSENEICDIDLKQKIVSQNDAFVFLYVGHISNLKGIDILINVLKEVRLLINIRIVLLIAGGTKQELFKIVGYTSDEDTRVLGFLQRDQIKEYYKKASCFIFPTRSDTWGLVLNEAIAAGCPVASSVYAGGTVDLIDDRLTGYVFDPLNYNEFKNTIIEIIQNRMQLPKMAENARLKLQTHNHSYSAKKISDFILNNG